MRYLYLILCIFTLRWTSTVCKLITSSLKHSWELGFYFIQMMVIFIITGMQLIQVHQEPTDLVLYFGSSLNVFCSITGISNPNLYWYRWTPEAGFKLVFTSVGTGIMDPASEGPFKSQRPENLQLVLESAGVNETGSTVWYCAASPHSIPEHTYSCTKTTPSH
uniref:Ig-like domain-containing protein n=1 Tax=Electrophorus electricus TaxID=8005 RepID=A0A4W4EXK2_ELEEL